VIISKFGVKLTSIQFEDLETIRNWRNDDRIRTSMIFQNIIQSADQIAWFESLSHSDAYFMISFNENKIGVANVKAINWDDRSGEAGVFIGNEDYTNSPIPLFAIHAMMDTFFKNFKFKSLLATVTSSNVAALEMNIQLGYEIIYRTKHKVNLKISSERYFENRSNIESLLTKTGMSESKLQLDENEKGLFDA
jgi:UDP-4-amino-4,6-dideoxy-N-acetyl-beta-L-altrosamine N-acetyltransferase